MRHASSSAPTVTVLHADETLLDLLQYALEQAGIATHAILLDAAAPVELALPYLPARTDACIVGLGQPLAYARNVLAALGPWLAGRPVLGLTPSPALVQAVFGPAVTSYVQATSDPEQTAGAAVGLVRGWLGRPAPAPLLLPALLAHATAVCTAARETVLLSQELRTRARSLRHAPAHAGEA